MILAEPEKFRNAINAIMKDIAYMALELKKMRKKYFLKIKTQIFS